MEIKKGIIVRVSCDLTYTEKLWGINKYMLKMKNTLRQVQQVIPNAATRNGQYSTCIYLQDENNSNWHFSIKDVTIPEKTPPSKPVMFNPANL